MYNDRVITGEEDRGSGTVAGGAGGGAGGALGYFWVGMCRPGLQIGTPF